MYNTEQILVNSILDRFEREGISIKKYNKKNIKILTEVKLGYWIPDIVIINKKNKISSIRDTVLKMFDISILDIIMKRKEVSINSLLDLTKSSKKQISNSLSILINEKIISKKWEDMFEYINYQVDISDCIAIEVKLKNWERALHQAHRYKWFANQAYVLLPETNIKPALKNIELFKKFNVWLLWFSDSTLECYFEPEENLPISNQMSYLLNEQLILA